MKTPITDSIMKNITRFEEWVWKYRVKHFTDRVDLNPDDKVFRQAPKLFTKNSTKPF